MCTPQMALVFADLAFDVARSMVSVSSTSTSPAPRPRPAARPQTRPRCSGDEHFVSGTDARADERADQRARPLLTPSAWRTPT